jgi:hypothetical protein
VSAGMSKIVLGGTQSIGQFFDIVFDV